MKIRQKWNMSPEAVITVLLMRSTLGCTSMYWISPQLCGQTPEAKPRLVSSFQNIETSVVVQLLWTTFSLNNYMLGKQAFRWDEKAAMNKPRPRSIEVKYWHVLGAGSESQVHSKNIQTESQLANRRHLVRDSLKAVNSLATISMYTSWMLILVGSSGT